MTNFERYFMNMGALIAALGVTGCDRETAGSAHYIDDNDRPGVPGLLADGEAGAAVFYRGSLYKLELEDGCGQDLDSNYRTWARSPNQAGKKESASLELLALSDGNWSIIDFYPGQSGNILRVYRDGADIFNFNDGVLRFSGTTSSDGGGEYVEIEIRCR